MGTVYHNVWTCKGFLMNLVAWSRLVVIRSSTFVVAPTTWLHKTICWSLWFLVFAGTIWTRVFECSPLQFTGLKFRVDCNQRLPAICVSIMASVVYLVSFVIFLVLMTQRHSFPATTFFYVAHMLLLYTDTAVLFAAMNKHVKKELAKMLGIKWAAQDGQQPVEMAVGNWVTCFLVMLIF